MSEERVQALKGLIQEHLSGVGISEKIDRALRQGDKNAAIQSFSR